MCCTTRSWLTTAEYVIASAMLLLRGAYRATPEVMAGVWPRKALSNGREIGGKTLGLVGFGSIGQLTARLAQGMGMVVIACDAMMNAEHPAFAQAGVRGVGLDALTAAADDISLHVPLVDATRHLFDAQRIAAMKPGAVLINSARGGVVDDDHQDHDGRSRCPGGRRAATRRRRRSCWPKRRAWPRTA